MSSPTSPQARQGTRQAWPAKLLSILLAAALMLVASATGATAVQSNVTPAANPLMAERCDLDLAISLDLSNSVEDDQLVDMKAAVIDLVSQLAGYPIRFAIHNFATNAPATSGNSNRPLPLTALTPQGITAITNHVNRIGRPQPQQGGTNWDAAFHTVRTTNESYDALLFVTDGNPTQYTRSNGTIGGPGNSTDEDTLDAAVTSANALKATGTRIVPIGVSDNLTGTQLTDFVEHITQVSGPTVGSDYFISDFAQLARPLIEIANVNCASIDLTKTGELAGGEEPAAGATVNYTFTVTNDGLIPLTGVEVTDPKPGLSAIAYSNWPGAPGTLQPGESVTATATYTLTAADVLAGQVDNTATVTGNPHAGDPVTDEDPETVRVTADPAIELVKTGALADGSTGRVGDVVEYDFTIRNTGNVTLDDVTLVDPLPGLSTISYGTWPGAQGTLRPGQSVTATATYALTQADVDAGGVDNTATVTADDPAGDPVTDSDDETVTVTGTPEIAVTKSGTLAPGASGRAGDEVTYTFTVTNTGAVTLTDVELEDPLPGLSAITYGAWPGADGRLQSGESVTATATYTLTQSDVDAGKVDNTATVTGTPPTGADVTDSDDETVPVDAAAAIHVLKSGDLAADARGEVGDEVTYTFTVTNTGDATLTDVTLADPLPGLSTITFGTWPAAAGTLAPGEQVTATATYELTQADVDAGAVDNTVTATGTPQSGDPVDDTDDETITVTPGPRIDVVKAGALAPAATGVVGDLVTYDFTVTNTGNVTLRDVTLTDPMQGLSTITFGTWPGAEGTLRPGQSVTATATYALTQADIAVGVVDNTATATGTPPTGDPVDNSDDETVPVPQRAAIGLVKSGALAPGASGTVGEVVEYDFTITNTGNLVLTDVELSDELVGLSAITFGTWPGAEATLRPGQSVAATATYTLTQADVDAGGVDNDATTTGKPVSDTPVADVTDTDDDFVPVARDPQIMVEKSGALADGATGRAGDVVEFGFTVTNTGNVTLTDVELDDPMTGLSTIEYGAWPAAAGTLLPGESVTATATYTLTQADVNAGSVENTVTAIGTPPTGDPVEDPDTEIVVVPGAPAIHVAKSGALAADAQGVAGDEVTFTFTVTNTGNVTLNDVELDDPLPGLSAITFGTWPGAEGRLQPGASVTATATYVLKQADVNAGGVENTVTAFGTPPTGDPVENPDTEIVTVDPTPAIEVTKTGALDGNAAAGEQVTYTFTVTNIGNVTLDDVELDDPLPGLSAITFGTWPGVDGRLQPGASVTATATYELTQADVDAGAVDNTVTAVGTPPSGDPVDDTDDETVTVPAAPAVQVLKSGALADGAEGRAGDVVDYTFTVTNTGNVTLTDVELDDPLPGLSAITFGAWPAAAGTLAPGESVTATASYTLTQADVDAGAVDNTVTAVGTPPTGDPVDDTDDETVQVTPGPRIDVVKSGTLPAGTVAAAGDEVTYTFTVTNTGNVTLTGVTLDDPKPGLSAITFGDWPAAAGTLAPGESVSATATYELTQADVNAGTVDNTVTAVGTPPTGDPVENEDPEDVPLPSAPAIDVVKTGALADGATGRAGDVVEYGFTVTNRGNVTLTDVELDDPLPGLSDTTYGDWPAAAGTLAPGESVTATASYTLTQADVDNGGVDNTVTAVGTPPSGDPVDDEDTETVTVTATPRIDVVKTGALDGTVAAGEQVTYTFTVTNTGNVTLADVELDDPKPGLSTITYGDWPAAAGTLAPGDQVTATATYELTQADVDAASVANTVTVTGTPPTGDPVENEDPEDVPLPSAPAIDVVKTGALAEDATGNAGDEVEYGFTVTNTGNVTLTGVELDDPLPGLTDIEYAWPGATGTLAPGESATATASYTLTQGDVDNGRVDNTVTAVGTPPTGDPVDDEDTETVTVDRVPAIDVVKTGALAADATNVAGDEVTYDFTVTNTGNVTLRDVTLTDPLPGLSAITFGDWPATAGTLAPGESVTASATYTLTQGDVDAGKVDNTATATGNPPSGDPVTDSDDETVDITQLASIDLVKTGALVDGAEGRAGDVVEYGFTVTNRGNVTLTGVDLVDPLPGLSEITFGDWPATAGTLAPGESVTASATYTLTQGDVDAGKVDNTATTGGTPPAGNRVTDTDDQTVPVPPGASVDLVKTSELVQGAASKAGDEVRYGFTVTNDGTTTLRDVTITDELPGLSKIVYGDWPATAGTLAPGESVTATASYTLTQGDIDSGSLVNEASVTGVPPTGDTPTDTDTEETPLPGKGAVSLVKDGERDGDVVRYTFVATNVGTVTLTDVEITDELRGLSKIAYGDWPGKRGVLEPGEKVTATATYRLTDADRDRGHVDNLAVVTGDTPDGEVVDDEDDVRIVVDSLPDTGAPVGLLGTLVAGLLVLGAGVFMLRRPRES